MVGGTKMGRLSSMKPFFIFAIALLVIGLVITLFIRTPKDNEVVVTDEELAKAQLSNSKTKENEFEGWTAKEVMKIPWFWVFSVGFLIIGLGLASLNEDYAAFLDTKLSFDVVGTIGMMYGVGCLIGNVTGGILFDKLGTAKAMFYAGLMYILSIAMMIFVSFQPFGSHSSKIAGIAYAIFCGLAVFSYMSGPAFMAKDLFGSKDQGVMLGLVGLAYAIGFAVGAPLFGFVKDLANFTIAWYVMMACVVLGFILLIWAIIQIKKIQKKSMSDTQSSNN